MLENIYDEEIQMGNPSPEEGDVLDLLGRAIDSPDGVWVSPSIEDNGGSRLGTGGMRSGRGNFVRDRDQAAEMAGISREDFDQVEDFVSNIDIDGEIPGEIEGGISRGEDLGKRTSWGARVSSNNDAREGYLEDGPLKGSRWELISERVEAASTFNDPGETLSGRDYLQIDTPDGVRLEFESETWEDPMYFDRAIQISGGGMRSGRSGGGPDTRNSLADDPKYSTKVPSNMKDVRSDLAMLAANGWVWEERGMNIYFAYPDRMYEWAKSQPDSWRRGFGESLMRGGVIPRHFGVHPRGAKKGDNTPVIKEMKKRVNAIFGADAWSDMQKNAKNNGVGKIGDVPSVVPAGGMTSGRGRLRSAQDEITGAAGLGGGMRARRFGGGRNGIKKVNDRDGSIMDQLSDDQKKQMVEAALEREGQLFWAITQGGLFRALRNTMEDDGRYEGMSVEERKNVPIDNDLIPRMQKMLDDALRDGEVTEEAYAKFQRQIDDIKTLNNMRERGNHDLLEHLHEPSRKEIVKKARAKDNTIPTLAKLGGGGESTFYNDEAYASAQGVGKSTADRAAKRRGKKRIPLFDRLLDPDPNRAQRRANRRARRRGLTGGRRAADVNLADTVRLRRRIARQLRRARRRLRGERNEKSIREALANKRSTHPLKRDSLGRPVVDKAFISHMAELGRLKGDRDRGERSKETADDFLRDLWENGNMNELPELLSEDEVQALLDSGWKPVFRGVGPRETQNQYTDAYKEDRDARFISDPHKRAYGTGEYWAPEGSGHWGGYGRGMVGFVDPDGRKISGSDIEDIRQKHSALRKEMSALMAELGEGVLKGEDPANAVSQMRSRIKQAEDRLGVAGMLDNEMGQIYSQWLDYYGGLSADSADRDAAWTSFEYMQDLTRLDSGYYAAFLGYDYVTHGGVTLVHNRGTVAVADVSRAISAEEANELLKKGKDGSGVAFPS
jgi:ribosomal protein S21